jgi:hypothetical protein
MHYDGIVQYGPHAAEHQALGLPCPVKNNALSALMNDVIIVIDDN